MEYTQEQIDAMLADAKKGLFSEEELQRRVTAETDRRVETGIQKGLETQKKKWEEEFSQRAKLTAEELAKKEIEEKERTLTAREKDILKRANELEAKSMLANAEIPKSNYEKFIGLLISDDAEATKSNVQNFIDAFNATKTDIETKVKSDLQKIPKPNQGSGDSVLTKAEFDKLSYSEKMKVKLEKPELFKEFMK